MKQTIVMILACIFISPLYAGGGLPAPSASLPTPPTAVQVHSVNDDQKDIALYGTRLAENTLPEPQVHGHPIFTDSMIESTHRLAPPMKTKTKRKNSVDFYVTGGAGFSSLKTNGTVTSAFIPATTTYTANSTSTNGIFSIASAYTFHKVRKKPVDVSLGLDFMGTSKAEVKGTSLSAGVATLPYSYDVSSKALFFEQRAAYHPKQYPTWQPYLVTGFGPSWNRMSDFTGDNGQVMINLSSIPSNASQNFSSNTESSFAYEAGLGVQHPISSHLSLSADYRYINFGKASLGGIPAYPTVTSRLSTSSIGENTVLLSLKASFAT